MAASAQAMVFKSIRVPKADRLPGAGDASGGGWPECFALSIGQAFPGLPRSGGNQTGPTSTEAIARQSRKG